MKGFAVVLLCAFIAVEARYAVVPQSESVAALGENPWIVHIRIAQSNSGFLGTCSGSLISANSVISSASCLQQATFIWNRFGVVNVINPSLVLEAGVNNRVIHPNYNAQTGENDIAIITFGRFIEFDNNISPVKLADADAEVPSSANLCVFGADEDNNPGVLLKCSEQNLDEINVTAYDAGAPVVVDGVQYGVVAGDGVLKIADYLPWIKQVAGL